MAYSVCWNLSLQNRTRWDACHQANQLVEIYSYRQSDSFDWYRDSTDEKDAITEIESLKPIFLYTQVEVRTLTKPSDKEDRQDMGDGDA